MLSLLRRSLVATALTVTASAFAGPVSQDEAAPRSANNAASGIPGADGLETGDAGKLANMVDQMARSASSPAAARPLPPAVAKGTRAAGANGDTPGENGDERDGPRRPVWLGGETDTSATTSAAPVIRERDTSAGRAQATIFDEASTEDRGRIRDVVFMLKEVVYHPITWLVVLVLIAVSLLSTGRRR